MRAGFGAATISPELPCRLAGFGARTEPANAVRDDLEARAMFLDDDTTALCLVVCDLLGMTPGFSGPLRSRIAVELGVGVECVLVACTHTHHGPSVLAGSEALGWPVPEGYTEVLSEGCVAAVRHARGSAQAAELRYGRAPLPDGVSFNRRGLPYDDPSFAVLDVVRPDGHRIGVVANVAVHPVALGPGNLAISCDWVGAFRTELERLAGGFAVMLSGALGDVNPLPRAGVPDDAYEPWATSDETDAIGRRIADAVADSLDDVQPISPALRVLRAETRTIPLGATGLAQLARAAAMDVDFVEWSIGDVPLVSVPGEAFTALGGEIERARGGRTLIAGIAPSWHGYLPVPWGDGYEEGVSFGEGFVAAVRGVLTTPP